MAPTSRKRAVTRAPRRARAGASDDDSSSATLQPIGEDTELPKTLSATSTGTHISESPDHKAESRKKGVRARDAATEDDVAARKKRRALELLAELEAEGVSYFICVS